MHCDEVECGETTIAVRYEEEDGVGGCDLISLRHTDWCYSDFSRCAVFVCVVSGGHAFSSGEYNGLEWVRGGEIHYQISHVKRAKRGLHSGD